MIGERLGTWVIFKELGRGGMGRVFLAQEELTGRKAAIKVLAAELAQDAGFLHRFQREIAALGALDHPNIVRFYEAGCENGIYYYAMEYVEGQGLDEALERQGRLPWREVLDVVRQVCPALRHVHDHGIIHRDLKPSNLLRTADGLVKLTDFGIARVFASTHLTATGGIVGTAEFLSPEQAAGKVAGKRSDIYSLGVVMYTLLTGRPPFTGGSYVELLHKHRYGQFDRPIKIVPELPYEIDELVCQMMEKEVDKRPRDCFALSKQLEAISKRLDRKGSPTNIGQADDATHVEGKSELASFEGIVGPSTLMSRLIRAEVERAAQGGPIRRFINRPWVLVTLFLLCLGILVWTFWPYSERQLFEHGAALMQTGELVDMERAWREYLGPLNARFPEHAYQAEVAEYRRRLEEARDPSPGEAERVYRLGETMRRQGDYERAARQWRDLIEVFCGEKAEQRWVRQAEKSLAELEGIARRTERWKQVRPALRRARELHRAGKVAEAERLWAALEELYAHDPGADDLLRDVRHDRERARKGGP